MPCLNDKYKLADQPDVSSDGTLDALRKHLKEKLIVIYGYLIKWELN
jgi:hypothetical protein